MAWLADLKLIWPVAALIGLLGGLATMAGDLWESMLKRRFGVKDSGDLIPAGKTQVFIQQRQQGVACVNSWGAWPLPQYLLPYKDYDFTFAIKPVK